MLLSESSSEPRITTDLDISLKGVSGNICRFGVFQISRSSGYDGKMHHAYFWHSYPSRPLVTT
jgi:hypothetical protein